MVRCACIPRAAVSRDANRSFRHRLERVDARAQSRRAALRERALSATAGHAAFVAPRGRATPTGRGSRAPAARCRLRCRNHAQTYAGDMSGVLPEGEEPRHVALCRSIRRQRNPSTAAAFTFLRAGSRRARRRAADRSPRGGRSPHCANARSCSTIRCCDRAVEEHLSHARWLELERTRSPQTRRRRRSQIERETRRAETIGRVAETVNSSLELDVVLRRVLDTAVEVMNAQRGFVMIADERTGKLELTTMLGLDRGALESEEMRPSQTAVRTRFRNRRADFHRRRAARSAILDTAFGARLAACGRSSACRFDPRTAHRRRVSR